MLSYLLHPPHLRSGGLAEALPTSRTDSHGAPGSRSSVDIAPGAGTIDDDVALQLFRVCQEALTNVYRHANAHKALVVLNVDDAIRLTVNDDGIGFDAAAPEDRSSASGCPACASAWPGSAARSRSPAIPAGTTLVASLPLSRPVATHDPGTRPAA